MPVRIAFSGYLSTGNADAKYNTMQYWELTSNGLNILSMASADKENAEMQLNMLGISMTLLVGRFEVHKVKNYFTLRVDIGYSTIWYELRLAAATR